MSALAVPHLALPDGLVLPGDAAFETIRRGVRERMLGSEDPAWRRARDRLIQWAGFSNAAEIDVLDTVFGDHASINLYAAPTYLALTTTAVGETDTGSTLTEANYTGYARKAVAAADMGAATPGAKASVNQLQFATATAGSSVVIGWAECTALTVGAVIIFGTCSSVTISSTQTPATIAIGALAATLD